MADPKNVKPTQTTTPAPVKAPTVPATAQAALPVEEKKKRGTAAFFQTAEAAATEASGREKGVRRAFTVKSPSGKNHHCVAYNDICALGMAAQAEGWTTEELGKKARAVKAVNAGSILDMIKSLPADQQELVKAQMKTLGLV